MKADIEMEMKKLRHCYEYKVVYDYLITRALLAQIRLFGSSLLNYGWKGCGQLKILKPGILRHAAIETISPFHW